MIIFLFPPNGGWLCYVVQKLELHGSSDTETVKSYSASILKMTFEFFRYSGYIFFRCGGQMLKLPAQNKLFVDARFYLLGLCSMLDIID